MALILLSMLSMASAFASVYPHQGDAVQVLAAALEDAAPQLALQQTDLLAHPRPDWYERIGGDGTLRLWSPHPQSDASTAVVSRLHPHQAGAAVVRWTKAIPKMAASVSSGLRHITRLILRFATKSLASGRWILTNGKIQPCAALTGSMPRLRSHFASWWRSPPPPGGAALVVLVGQPIPRRSIQGQLYSTENSG